MNCYGKGIIGSANYLADEVNNNSIYYSHMVQSACPCAGSALSTITRGRANWTGDERLHLDNLFTYEVSKLVQWASVLQHMYDKGVHYTCQGAR